MFTNNNLHYAMFESDDSRSLHQVTHYPMSLLCCKCSSNFCWMFCEPVTHWLTKVNDVRSLTKLQRHVLVTLTYHQSLQPTHDRWCTKACGLSHALSHHVKKEFFSSSPQSTNAPSVTIMGRSRNYKIVVAPRNDESQ